MSWVCIVWARHWSISQRKIFCLHFILYIVYNHSFLCEVQKRNSEILGEREKGREQGSMDGDGLIVVLNGTRGGDQFFQDIFHIVRHRHATQHH
jgi:hypothetical protein